MNIYSDLTIFSISVFTTHDPISVQIEVRGTDYQKCVKWKYGLGGAVQAHRSPGRRITGVTGTNMNACLVSEKEGKKTRDAK